MPTALTEDAGDANFGVGLAVPSNGDDSVDWAPNLIAALQQLADRSQLLKRWVIADPSVHVPLTGILLNEAGYAAVGWDMVVNGNRHYWLNGTIISPYALYFSVPPLPVGRKITGVTAYYQNPNNTTLPVASPPTLALYKTRVTVGGSIIAGSGADAAVLVGSQADTVAVVADYKLNHTIALTGLTETIDEDENFVIKFTGESSTNSTTGGALMALRVHLGA